ncbi:hypothetical protein TRFO_25153 [Tritrichomonas foetus]|uniref:Uncharacterized protein n=1 Tax=Tritrichomonas foetus TaxID=1144522 RepID=A0A1J4K718_9EUKA|nr:hypothetical protein TRFO_25153 [Tritrichomonas foetus]|eukprot:OHT06696.1 hypothetical protein TRFO_25153 [Tritrichomonas foetus]
MISYIKPILHSIHDKLRLIAGGPQLILKENFNKFSAISNLIQKAIIEQDKMVDPSCQLQPLYNDVVIRVMKFSEYLPQLTSSTAPTFQAYIPELQKLISDSLLILDNIVNIISTVEQGLSKTLSPPKNLHELQECASIISTIESLVIDLSVVQSYESIQESSQDEYLKEWIDILESTSKELFNSLQNQTNRLHNNSNISFILDKIVEKSPTLFTVISQTESILKNKEDFVKTANHSIVLIELISKFRSEHTDKIVMDIISQIPILYMNGKSVYPLLEKAIEIHKISSQRIVDASFLCNWKDTISSSGTITELLETCKNEESELQVIAIISVMRFYAMTVSGFETSYDILNQLTNVIAKILNNYFEQVSQSATTIFQVYNSDLSLFNENALGQLSYHISQITSIKSLDIHSALFFPELQRSFNSICSLPHVLQKTISSCTNENVQRELNSEYEINNEIAFKYAKWHAQLLLTVSSEIQLRAETVGNSLIYLHGLNLDLPKNILDATRTIHSLCQSTSHYILVDISDIIKIFENFSIINSSINTIVSCIGEQGASVYYPLMFAYSKIIKFVFCDYKVHMKQMSALFKFEESFDFVAAITAYLNQLIPMISETQRYLQLSNKLFAFFFSIPYTGINILCAIIQNNIRDATTLMNFPTTAKVSLEVIWPLSCAISAGTNEVDDEKSLIIYTNSIPKLLADMLTAISLLPQPCNEINISEELRELTKMEKTAISLKPSLKFFANIIISWIRSDNVTNAIMIARKWFQAIKNPTRDFGEAASLFLQSTMELNTNSDDLEKFFDSFCYLSASLGDNEDTFDKYSELVRTQHEEIFLVVKDILKGEKHMTKVSLKISSSIVFITSLSRYGNVKKDEYLNLYNEKYKKVIIHFAHDPNRLKSSKYLFKAMKDIYKLIALDVISRLNDYNEKLDVQTLLSPLIKNLLHRRVNGEIVQPILQTLSSRLLELNPIEFDFTQKNKYDIDSIVDKMYEKVEIFRECANIILRE